MISGLVMQFREKDNNVLNFVFLKMYFCPFGGFSFYTLGISKKRRGLRYFLLRTGILKKHAEGRTMITIEAYDNERVFERYTILVLNGENPDLSYGISIAEDPDMHTYLHPVDEVGSNTGKKISLDELPMEQQKVLFAFLADDLANMRIRGGDIPQDILGSVFSIVSSDRYPPLGGALVGP
jgi:hypothetical protein